MYRLKLHIIIISCLLFYTACDENDPLPEPTSGSYPYIIGDYISEDDLQMRFDFCYPSCPASPSLCEDLTTDEIDTTFSFSNYIGSKVFMIEMSASW